MVVWDRIKKGGGALLLLLVAACGDVGGSGQCGGADLTGSCLQIESIQPGDANNEDTSNVDAFQDLCNAFEVAEDPTVEPDFETITDHNAEITISNEPLPGVTAEDISKVTLSDYSITYSVNRCPAGASCPALNSLTTALVQEVPANGSVAFTLPFVPLSTKFEYEDLGGSSNAYSSYTATYTIIGTDSFQNPVSVQGSAEFTIGNYDNCEG